MACRVFTILKVFVIAGATWFVFAPVVHGGWLWDDPAEITTNGALRSWGGLWKIWFAADSADYYPLKTTVQWVQWHLWGKNLLGYHLTNIGLHLLSAYLIWHLLWLIFRPFDFAQGRRLRSYAGVAWVGGLLFAVHPLAVESVAWIAELKNVLSLPLLLLSMILYLRWNALSPTRLIDSGAGQTRWGQRVPPYLAAFLFFIAAMLCKASVVMFPMVLLLFGWWREGRVTRADVRAAAPFFGVSLGLGIVTVWFQHHFAISNLVIAQGGFWSRLAVAGLAVMFYLGKFFLPVGLLPIYPRWAVDPPAVWQFWPWGVMVVLGWGGVLLRRRLGKTSRQTAWGQAVPPVFFGLGFFLVNLVPVLGFVPMSFLRISWVSDHFVYLPMIGLVGLVTAALGEFYNWNTVLNRKVGKDGKIGFQSSDPLQAGVSQDQTKAGLASTLFPTFLFKAVFWLVVFVIVAALAIESRSYASRFVSEEALWNYTLKRNPEAWLARNNLGNLLLAEGRGREAEAELRAALKLKPDFSEAYNNLGNILLGTGQLEEARADFEEAIRLRPDYAEAYNGLGNYFQHTGQPRQSIPLYLKALELKPEYPDCRDNFGAALDMMGDYPGAIAEYERVFREAPGFALAHYNLATTLAKIGRKAEAIEQYQEALRLDPKLIQADNNLGNAYADAHRLNDAIPLYEKALRIDPNYFEVHINLANALAKTGHPSEAIAHYEQALKLRPDYGPGHHGLGAALQSVGRTAEANAEFAKAARLQSAQH